MFKFYKFWSLFEEKGEKSLWLQFKFLRRLSWCIKKHIKLWRLWSLNASSFTTLFHTLHITIKSNEFNIKWDFCLCWSWELSCYDSYFQLIRSFADFPRFMYNRWKVKVFFYTPATLYHDFSCSTIIHHNHISLFASTHSSFRLKYFSPPYRIVKIIYFHSNLAPNHYSASQDYDEVCVCILSNPQESSFLSSEYLSNCVCFKKLK